MARKNRSREMEDRMERMPTETDSHGDQSAGDEGVDDPAMSATHRDDMTETPMHGDRLGEGDNTDASLPLESDEMMDAQDRTNESGQRMQSQRSERTEERSNDEKWDDASDFSGRGSQKEGSDEAAEGTGYEK